MLFKYTGTKKDKKISGILSATSLREATANLRKSHVRVSKIKEIAGEKIDKDASILERSAAELFFQKFFISSGQVSRAFDQLASLLESGVPIMKAFRMVARLSPFFLRRALYCVANKISGGSPLYSVMQQEMPFLGRVTLSLVAVGESNGTLQDMFRYASDLMMQKRKVKADLMQAFAYPAFVMLATVGAVWFLMEKVIPKVMKFLTARNVEMPKLTQMLIDAVNFLNEWGVWLLVSPIVLVAAILISRRSHSVAVAQDFILLQIPFFGKIASAAANVMWCRTLGILMFSGTNILRALRLTAETQSNLFFREQFFIVEDLTRQGQELSTGVRVSELSTYCPIAESMIKIGENTGLIDQKLRDVAANYQQELDRRLSLMAKFIEPVMFVVIGGLVAFVYIGFFIGLMALAKR